MITRRCTQQQFLLRPDPETNNAVIYCIAVAAHRHGIDVIDFIQMSNHLHDGIFDRYGKAPEFYADCHRLIAKCVNALRGRWENFFASQQTSVVRVDTREELIDRLVYIATNPVKAGLVEKVDEWPGASGYQALMTGKPLRATRPKHFFSKNGVMPEEIELHLRIPPELGDQEEILAEVRKRVEAVEASEAQARAASGRRALGRYAVLRQSWRSSPTKHEPRRRLSPTFGGSIWAQIESAQRRRDFITGYRKALKAQRDGDPIPFPFGTYWRRHHLFVDVVGMAKPEKN